MNSVVTEKYVLVLRDNVKIDNSCLVSSKNQKVDNKNNDWTSSEKILRKYQNFLARPNGSVQAVIGRKIDKYFKVGAPPGARNADTHVFFNRRIKAIGHTENHFCKRTILTNHVDGELLARIIANSYRR